MKIQRRSQSDLGGKRIGYDVGFRIEVVSDDGGEGEQADDHSDKVDADRSDDSCYALLQKRDPGVAAVCPITGQKDQEYGRGTD